MRRTIAVVCCLQCACISWRPVPSVVELTGTQVVRVDYPQGHVLMRNAHGCPDAASFTGSVLSFEGAAQSLLGPPRCECSAPSSVAPCAGVLMRPDVKVRVRVHDEDKTVGFVFGMVFAGAAAAALTVLGVFFFYALTHVGADP